MTVQRQRNSLRRSSISINIIRNSVSGLSKGLSNIGKRTNEILKTTRDSNNFKKNLNRRDNDFFRKRRENVLRKQREDELEASSVTGVAKRQGSLIQKSTRGFFGRILDFLGVLLLGWALQNLPKFIEAFQKLFKLITKVVGIMTGFLKVITGFASGIGKALTNFLSVFSKIDLGEGTKQIKELFDKGVNSLIRLNKDFIGGIVGFLTDEQIQSASLQGQVEELGLQNTNQQEEVQFNTVPSDNLKQEIIEDRDNGGNVKTNTPYLIALNPQTGEPDERTELFIPEQDGFVANNEDTENLIQGQQTGINDEQITKTTSEEDIQKESDLFVEDNAEEGLRNLLGTSKSSTVKKGEEILPRNEIEKNLTDAEKFFMKGGKNQVQEGIIASVTPTKKTLPPLAKNKKNKNQVIIVEKAVNIPSSSSPVLNSNGKPTIVRKNSDLSTMLAFQSVSSLKYT